METALVERLEAVAARLERAASKMGSGGGGDDDEVPPFLAEYQAIMDSQLEAIYKACVEVKVKKCGVLLKKAYKFSTDYLSATVSCKKPSNEAMQEFMQPLSKIIADMETEKNRRDKRKTPDRSNYRKAIYELVLAATWASTPGPVLHINTQNDSAQFSINRMLKDKKEDKDKNFKKVCVDFSKALVEFVKNNDMKQGVLFRGKNDISSFSGSSAASAAKAAAPAKKTPKKEAESKDDDEKKEPKQGTGGMGNVFGELSKGLKITSGLKKVSKDQKTKYRKKEAGRGKVTMKKKKTSTKKKKKGFTKQTPGRVMFADYGEGVLEIPDGVDMKTNLFITGCSDCGFDVVKKVKAVALDNCKNVRIAVSDCVSVVEMVNCKRVTVYVKGNVPTVQIDKSESPSVIIMKSAESIPQIFASMVTAGNVELSTPTEEDPDHMTEYPIPEQFRIKVLDGNKGIAIDSVEH